MRLFLLALIPLFTRDCLAQRQPETVEAYLQSEMQNRKIPGLQVAVVQHGKIVLLLSYGLANLEDSAPVTNNTVFSIASMTPKQSISRPLPFAEIPCPPEGAFYFQQSEKLWKESASRLVIVLEGIMSRKNIYKMSTGFPRRTALETNPSATQCDTFSQLWQMSHPVTVSYPPFRHGI